MVTVKGYPTYRSERPEGGEFKRQCARNGALQEVRKREHYEKPSVKRKKKSEAARKRKF